jgi:predicted MPP superfamily phosphohydrolase
LDATDLLLAFLAWVGHATIWLVVLNFLYSQAIHRKLLRTARLVDAALVFSFPPLLAVLSATKTIHTPLVLAYLLLCLGITLVAIPIATLVRQLRRIPSALKRKHSIIVDYAKELGYPPIGQWKNAALAKLPRNEVFQVEFAEIDLVLPDLPAAWNGLTILHLTDLHLCGTPERVFFERVLDHCMRDGTPDIIAVTGDLVDTDDHHEWIVPLFARLRWNELGVAILGNHDYWQKHEAVRARLAEAGFLVLGNGWCEREIRGHRLITVGHEGPWFGPEPDLSGVPPGGFRLALSHTPDNIRWAQRHQVRLLLCGHTHGWQIRLPLFGSLFVPSRYSRRYDEGLFECPPTLMYVSRGLSGRDPLRYRCRPEVTRLRLCCSARHSSDEKA